MLVGLCRPTRVVSGHHRVGGGVCVERRVLLCTTTRTAVRVLASCDIISYHTIKFAGANRSFSSRGLQQLLASYEYVYVIQGSSSSSSTAACLFRLFYIRIIPVPVHDRPVLLLVMPLTLIDDICHSPRDKRLKKKGPNNAPSLVYTINANDPSPEHANTPIIIILAS